MKTVLQTAIEQIKDECEHKHPFYQNGMKKAIAILTALLPEEEKFAESAYIAGETTEREYPFNVVRFSDYYSQFKTQNDDK